MAAARWDVLVDYATTPGGSDEALRVFLARDLSPTDSGFVREGEEAEIEVRWVPLEEAVDAVLAGRIHNPSAVAGLLAADRVLRTGSAPRPVGADWALRQTPRPA